jgi:hypothetical protein
MATEDLLFAGGVAALAGGIIIVLIMIILVIYLITALALYKIALKTKTENAWFAWIPFANIFLMAFIAKQP